MRAISGLLKPSAGEIRAKLDGVDVVVTDLDSYDVVRHGIAHVPEGRGLFAPLSVYDNLIAGSLFPRARSRRHERLEFVFGLFPRLRERSGQISSSLSGGEQQMLALGRALMTCPELLILDEQSIGLSPRVVTEFYRVLRELKQRTGITLLVIEQDIHHIARICDYAHVMSAGRIVRSLQRGELKQETVKEHYLGGRRS